MRSAQMTCCSRSKPTRASMEVNAGFDGFLARPWPKRAKMCPSARPSPSSQPRNPPIPLRAKAQGPPHRKRLSRRQNQRQSPKPSTGQSRPCPHSCNTWAHPRLPQSCGGLPSNKGWICSGWSRRGTAAIPRQRSGTLCARCRRPLARTGTTAAQASGRLTAEIASEGFTDFAAWAATTAKLTDTSALLAGLCAASHGTDTTVAVESFGDQHDLRSLGPTECHATQRRRPNADACAICASARSQVSLSAPKTSRRSRSRATGRA